MAHSLLQSGNGNQHANRRRALEFVAEHLANVSVIDERTVRYEPYGECHFAAYAHSKGAMISSTREEGAEFGTADWHQRANIMMFRDFGDGRAIVYICPIKPLFEKRAIGRHGVPWDDVLKLAVFKRVFKIDETQAP